MNFSTSLVGRSRSFFLRLMCGILVFLTVSLPAHAASARLFSVTKWAILLEYDPIKSFCAPEDLAAYDLVILDPVVHPQFDQTMKPKWCLAHIRIGAAEEIRAPGWEGRILGTVIPAVQKDGFNGVMLDGFDAAISSCGRNEKALERMRDAFVSLLREMRRAFPDLVILVSSTGKILSDLVTYTDGIVTEDICMTADPETKMYTRTELDVSTALLNNVLPARDSVRCPIFSLEFLNADDDRNKVFCRRKAARWGLRPYFAEKKLQKLYAQ